MNSLETYEQITAKRFAQFKNLYGIGTTMIAKGTEDLTEGSFNSYARGERKITSRSLRSFCLSYGLNPAWILGLSNIPYTEESILLAEKHYQEQYEENPYKNCMIPINSLETRANIICLRRFLKNYKKKQATYKEVCEKLKENLQYCINTGIAKYKL